MAEPQGRLVLLDACFIIALIHPDHVFHDKAVEMQRRLGKHDVLVTTDLVIAELLNFFAKRAKVLRDRAVAMFDLWRSSPNFIFVRLDHDDYDEALRRYRQPRRSRRRAPGLTDVHSMVVMEKREMKVAFTTDPAFTDAGFQTPMLS